MQQKAPKKDIDYIIEFIDKIYPVDEISKTTLYDKAFSIHVKKGEILIKQGEKCYFIYFIRKGALMAYSEYNNKKLITYISIEDKFVSSISGFFAKDVSLESVMAVEDCYLIGIHVKDMMELFQKSLSINYSFREGIQQYYQHAQERAYIARMGNVRERYLYFKETKPEYIDRLPPEYIAGLLAMKVETFLKIKKQETATRTLQSKDFLNLLEQYLTKDDLFKDKNVNCEKLAALIGIPTYKIARILNENYTLSCNTFINNYRIRYVQKELQGKIDWRSYTIDALASEAGFSSRSTFYKVFKKNTGMTPLEYVNKNKLHPED